MPRLTLITLLLVVFAIPVFAQDPGLQDSLIIDITAIEPGVPSAMLSIYAVTGASLGDCKMSCNRVQGES